MSGVTVTYKIPMGQVQRAITKETRRVTAKLNAARDEILQFAGQVQILSYTGSGNPSPPPGSHYDRTFTLQGAFETRVTSTKLPTISGEYGVNEGKARYASYVVGSRARQAKVHRGRWKSEEEVKKIVKGRAQVVIKKHINER